MQDTPADTTGHYVPFTEWEVRRALERQKTEFRRLIDPQPPHEEDITSYGSGDPVEEVWKYTGLGGKTEREAHRVKRPYMPGDIIYVQEPFRLPEKYEDVGASEYVNTYPYYAHLEADGKEFTNDDSLTKWGPEWGRVRPAEEMPSHFVRLRLRVEEVRAEHIKDLGTEDAINEGMPDPFDYEKVPEGLGSVALGEMRRTITELAFKAFWIKRHGEGAWERNDWVWVTRFTVTHQIPEST